MPARPFKRKAVEKLKLRRKRGQQTVEKSDDDTPQRKKQKPGKKHFKEQANIAERPEQKVVRNKKLKSRQGPQTKEISNDDIVEKPKQMKENTVNKIRKLQMQEANAEEDKTIKKMEKLLKLNKKKKKTLPASFKDEGLAYILDAIDRKEGDTILSDFSDGLEDDLAVATGKTKVAKNKAEIKPLQRPQPKQRTLTQLLREKEGTVSSDDEGSNVDKSADDINEDSFSESDEELIDDEQSESDIELGGQESDNDQSCDDMVSDESDDDSRIDDQVSDNDVEEGSGDGVDESHKTHKKTEKTKIWEDIYGRMRDEKGNVIKNTNSNNNLYVPPKLRENNSNLDDSKKEACLRIRRQLKGLLNRLSESNLQNICHQIEEIYMKNSRNDMNETLFSLVSELVFSNTMTPPRLIMEQAMLIALLHANVGPEVGAYFLQHITTKLGELFKDSDNYGEGKQCNNVLVFLSHLYNYKVTHSTLIFDIFRKLVESFTSKDIELIQLLLKNIGFVMRKDDPLQLKELIAAIQSKAPEFNKGKENDSRVKFMLETLTAIRNNNMYKIPDYDPSIIDHSKKLLRGMTRKGCSIQELNISFDDLLNAEDRGRWWIVGSAWAQTDSQGLKSAKTLKENFVLPKTEVSEKIMELARKQHMNTEVRKSIFCIIMTAEDFMDAFEKLLKLNLKNQQEREIIHVILHCVLQERNFNPYYAFLLERFCRFARKHMMCLQFSLWDKFKELSKMKSYQMNNLSRLLCHLFTSDALPLSVLKVIHFSDMDKTLVKFFRQILLSLLLHDSEEVCLKAFARIAHSDSLKVLRESLRLFTHHFVLRNAEEKLGAEVALGLQRRAKAVEGVLKGTKLKII